MFVHVSRLTHHYLSIWSAFSTTQAPVAVTEGGDTTIPNRTADEVKKEFPWIEEPESSE